MTGVTACHYALTPYTGGPRKSQDNLQRKRKTGYLGVAPA